MWWNSGTVLYNSVVEQWNSDGGKVKQGWWNSVVEEWKSVVEQ